MIACTLAGTNRRAKPALRNPAVLRSTPRTINLRKITGTIKLIPNLPLSGVCPSRATNFSLHALHLHTSRSTSTTAGWISGGISSICWCRFLMGSMSLLWQRGHSSAVIGRFSASRFHWRVKPSCPFGAPRLQPQKLCNTVTQKYVLQKLKIFKLWLLISS